MLSEDEDAMALLRRMAKATEEIAEKISPEFPFPPSWSTGNCSEHREKPQPLAVTVWRALDNLHQRCLSLGRSVDLHTALLKGIVSHLRLSELERRTDKETP